MFDTQAVRVTEQGMYNCPENQPFSFHYVRRKKRAGSLSLPFDLRLNECGAAFIVEARALPAGGLYSGLAFRKTKEAVSISYLECRARSCRVH